MWYLGRWQHPVHLEGDWRSPVEHPQSRCWLCTGMEAIILWSFPVPCELGHWFWGPEFSHCTDPAKYVAIPPWKSQKKPVCWIIQQMHLPLFQKFFILSPTTTLLWIKFFNFANYDERWHFREFDPEKIQNWPISADEFLITHPEWLWHIGCVTMVVMGHTARLAECLRDPRESSSEKADKIRKCLRQVLQGQVKKRKE